MVNFLHELEYLNSLERTTFCRGAKAVIKETYMYFILNLNLRSTKLGLLVNIIHYKKKKQNCLLKVEWAHAIKNTVA